MALGTAEIILFAIQSAVRLGQQARQAYVEATRAAAITLPLPDFKPSQTVDAAVTYLLSLRGSVGDPLPQYAIELLDRTIQLGNYNLLSADDRSKLISLHNEYLLIEKHRRGAVNPANDGSYISNEALVALVRIRQWRPGAEPHPTALQRMAGTLIDIAVDYYATGPGARDLDDGRGGRVVLAFLRGIDGIQFGVEPLGDLPQRMFVSLLQGIEENAALITGHKATQEFVQKMVEGLLVDVKAQIDAANQAAAGGSDTAAQIRATEWAELAFGSVIKHGADLVTKEPQKFLGVGAARGALIRTVGGTLIGIVGTSDGRLREVLNRAALDKLTDALFTVVAQHPSLVTNAAGFKETVAALANDLAAQDVAMSIDAVPEILRLVIARSAENLELFWPKAAIDAPQHLLLTLSKSVMTFLSAAPPAGAKWTPAFTSEDIRIVADIVLAEAVANPTWIIEEVVQGEDNLKRALTAVVATLRTKGNKILGTTTARELIEAAIKAVALRPEFLEPIGATAQPLAAVALDAVLEFAFTGGRPVLWQVARRETLVEVLRVTLDHLAKLKLDNTKLDALRRVLVAQAVVIENGGPWNIVVYKQALEAGVT